MKYHFHDADREILIIEADGELDVEPTVAMLNDVKAQIRETLRKVIVDCSNVEFLHTPGIGNLVSLQVVLSRRDGRLAVCCLKDQIAGMLQTLRLDQLLDIHENFDSALLAVQGQ